MERVPTSLAYAMTYTVGSVYKGEVEIPRGYEFVRFGIPQHGEGWIPTGTKGVVCSEFCSKEPRVIVRRKKMKRWVIEQLESDRRTVRPREKFMSSLVDGFMIEEWRDTNPSVGKYHVVSVREEEI